MAANYSQYTDHNEIGGVSVGLEDAKLAAADSVDEVASTDCVLMKDASGNPVKILKEDFNEAVRDALGSILSYNGLGTAIGKVAALGSSDNDFGSISTSDLASVLGGVLTGVSCIGITGDPRTYVDQHTSFRSITFFINEGSIFMYLFHSSGTQAMIQLVQYNVGRPKYSVKMDGGSWSEWSDL